MTLRWLSLALFSVAACAPSSNSPVRPSNTAARFDVMDAATPVALDASATSNAFDAAALPDASDAQLPASSLPLRVSLSSARDFLWPDGNGAPDTSSCNTASDPVECLLSLRWSQSPEALTDVLELWRTQGHVLGVERAHTMNGGYRGMISVVPDLPTGRYAQHLIWMRDALRDQDAFYRTVASHAPNPVAYRWTGLGIRFYRSLVKRTPAAYAHDWEFAYNVNGGINDSLDRIRTTLIHEVFHLNDFDHGNSWSIRELQPIFASIVSKCGANTNCLTPYAPNTLRVRNGTYYAFQPGNDVWEYAAELCVRYFLEQSGRWRGRAFKCGPPENARAWSALVREFYGGYDVVPACP